MAVDTFTTQNPLVITAENTINAAGQRVIDLTAAAPGAALLAANNLSDVGSAATARSNLGATATGVSLFTAANAAAAATAIGATATGSSLLTAASVAAAQTALGLPPGDFGVMDFNCDSLTPPLGAIKFQAITSGTVNTVRGTLYGTGPSDQAIAIDMTIGGVAVTGGGVTFILGSNDGATQNSTATANNTFVAGDVIAVGVTTTNTAALRGTFQIVYTRT